MEVEKRKIPHPNYISLGKSRFGGPKISEQILNVEKSLTPHPRKKPL